MPKQTERTPTVPSWLNDEAKAIWKQHARNLWELGLLTINDIDALATLCEATALYRTAVDMMRIHGAVWTAEDTGYTQRSAWATTRDAAYAQMRQMWTEFGMTPAARTRIQVEKPDQDQDDLAKLLTRGKRATGK